MQALLHQLQESIRCRSIIWGGSPATVENVFRGVRPERGIQRWVGAFEATGEWGMSYLLQHVRGEANRLECLQWLGDILSKCLKVVQACVLCNWHESCSAGRGTGELRATSIAGADHGAAAATGTTVTATSTTSASTAATVLGGTVPSSVAAVVVLRLWGRWNRKWHKVARK